MNLWISIVEASLPDLVSLETQLLGAFETPECRRQLFYIQVLKCFYRQDPAGIQRLLTSHADWLQNNSDLRVLGQIRYYIRNGDWDSQMIRDLRSGKKTFAPLMTAEVYFVCAAAHQSKGDFLEAESLYLQASALYEAASAHKKHLRALLSSIAAYSCAYPDSRLFAEYMNLYQRAKDAKEFLTAGTALLNVSREFQRLQGLSIAVEYITEAIHLLQDNAMGSREYGLSLAHRAHLYLDLKNYQLAQQDLLYALSIPHAEVQSACSALGEKYKLNLKSLQSQQVLPTWKERMTEKAPEKPLSKLESELLALIAERPRSKFELMDELYGLLIDLEAKENRFKNLLSRVRSRFPDLIFLNDQKYHLNDPLSRALFKKNGSEL